MNTCALHYFVVRSVNFILFFHEVYSDKNKRRKYSYCGHKVTVTCVLPNLEPLFVYILFLFHKAQTTGYNNEFVRKNKVCGSRNCKIYSQCP
jgi:hypothetical protein